MAGFLREGATACVAWDGAAGSVLVSVDGAPFASIFPPGTVRPSAAAGAALFPAICGWEGCVVEYSVRGELGLAPPSRDYLPCAQVLPAHAALAKPHARLACRMRCGGRAGHPFPRRRDACPAWLIPRPACSGHAGVEARPWRGGATSVAACRPHPCCLPVRERAPRGGPWSRCASRCAHPRHGRARMPGRRSCLDQGWIPGVHRRALSGHSAVVLGLQRCIAISDSDRIPDRPKGISARVDPTRPFACAAVTRIVAPRARRARGASDPVGRSWADPSRRPAPPFGVGSGALPASN